MRIVVGLGNPGARYERTRHNVGFMVIDDLASRWRIELAPPARALRIGRGEVDGQVVTLVQPYGFMNVSGAALSNLDVSWSVEDLIVVHDDMDIAAGQLRVRHGGGAGGHRGVGSLLESCGPEFDRVRVGVGRPATGLDPAEHVLMEMSGEELLSLRDCAARAADAVACLLSEGIEKAMSRFNGRSPRPQQSSEAEDQRGDHENETI
jgi:PTH1 family peptidyl-tRNA hydrolase